MILILQLLLAVNKMEMEEVQQQEQQPQLAAATIMLLLRPQQQELMITMKRIMINRMIIRL